jgi:hypothetical protein
LRALVFGLRAERAAEGFGDFLGGHGPEGADGGLEGVHERAARGTRFQVPLDVVEEVGGEEGLLFKKLGQVLARLLTSQGVLVALTEPQELHRRLSQRAPVGLPRVL